MPFSLSFGPPFPQTQWEQRLLPAWRIQRAALGGGQAQGWPFPQVGGSILMRLPVLNLRAALAWELGHWIRRWGEIDFKWTSCQPKPTFPCVTLFTVEDLSPFLSEPFSGSRLSAALCLWLPLALWTVLVRALHAEGWGGKGQSRPQGNQSPGLLSFHYVCLLSCPVSTSNGFFHGKLTFWLNRSNSHWVLIPSLPHFIPGGMEHQFRTWLGRWGIFLTEGCFLLHRINS